MADEQPKHRLAGMALQNGVLIIGPTRWAASVRLDDGDIATVVDARPGAAGDPGAAESDARKLPALRGPLSLFEMARILPAVRRELPESRFAFEQPGVLGGMVGGSLLSGALRRTIGRGARGELAASATALATLLVSLRGGEVAEYHGAEHKVIGGYEQGIPAREASKEHERCGTHLAVPLLLANVIGASAAQAALPGRPQLAKLLGSVAALSATTELARASQRNRDNPLLRGVHTMGMGLQSIASTREPTDDQLEVAQITIDALLEAEGPVQQPLERPR